MRSRTVRRALAALKALSVGAGWGRDSADVSRCTLRRTFWPSNPSRSFILTPASAEEIADARQYWPRGVSQSKQDRSNLAFPPFPCHPSRHEATLSDGAGSVMRTGVQDAAILSGKVTQEWIERGVLLSRAVWQFGSPIFAVPARAAAERFAELRDGETTEMFESSSLLSGAARDRKLLNLLYGDQKQAWLDYYINRDATERDLWFKLAWGGTLRAFGRNETPNKEPEWIPEEALFWLHPDPAKKDVVSGNGMVYWYVHVVDPRFYSDHPPSAPPDGPSRTGVPGRPTSIQLVEHEMRRRAAAGEMVTTFASHEAEVMAAWLPLAYPLEPRLRKKSIQNSLGRLWKELKAASQN